MSNSKFFYENENGCLLLKIVTHFSNNAKQLEITKIIAPDNSLHEYYYNICINQFNQQKNDILLSIYQSNPLHGILSVLNITMNFTTESLSSFFLENVLQLIIETTDHFIDILTFGAKTKEFPPSFAQMGESIELLAKSSAVNYEHSKNAEKLSNIHQLILNNIWLNLKACCELSLTLINKYCETTDSKNIEKCLQICIDVLTKCRHKGAIEAAGLILGNSVKQITSHEGLMHETNIIHDILSNFLKETTYGHSVGGSVTRRSAGLTILVHRIVTNDSSPDKRLFYFTMEFLIDYLHLMSVNKNQKNGFTDSNERDVPIARALHLLCRTVSESSLSNHIILFAPNLSDVCFNYLSSDEWQIRNAALQLYGALVPKIIGQKLVPNSEIESDSSVTIDELFLHIPSLLKTVKSKLIETAEMNNKNIISVHSNLIPMLSLLSSTTKRYPLIHRDQEAFSLFQNVYSNIEEISCNLKILLSSPIFIVRNMCAKIITTFYNISDIGVISVKNTENEVHGYLLCIKMFVKHYIFSKNLHFHNEEVILELENVFKHTKNILSLTTNSYYVKILLFEIECLLETKLENNLINFGNANSKYYPGYFEWQNAVLKHIIITGEETELIDKLNEIFQTQNWSILDECVFPILKEKIINRKQSISNSFLKYLLEYILKLIPKGNLHVGIYELLYIILNESPENEYRFSLENISHLKSIFKCEEGKYYQKYLFPLLCCFISTDFPQSNLSWIVKLTNYCLILVKPEHFDSSSRLMAAIAMKHLIPILLTDNITDEMLICKQNILKSLIYLLQDEDSDVRQKCVKHCNFSDKLKHPYHVLLNILTENFILKMFNDSYSNGIKFLKTCLQNTEINKNIDCDELKNPFDHNVSNIYWETFIINARIKKLIKCLEDNK